MSNDQVQHLRKKIRQIGTYVGIRWMRNQGIGIRDAYFVLFNRYPGAQA